jgi:hypothetical protein
MRSLHRGRWLLIGMLLSGILSGCGGGNGIFANPLLSTGVQGRATQGPTVPAMQVGMPIPPDHPVPGAIVTIQLQDGTEVARQTADSEGNYRIGLPPGTYRIVGLSPADSVGRWPTPPLPQSITIPTDQYLTADLSYDSGIR